MQIKSLFSNSLFNNARLSVPQAQKTRIHEIKTATSKATDTITKSKSISIPQIHFKSILPAFTGRGDVMADAAWKKNETLVNVSNLKLFSGKTDDELRSIAVNSINWLYTKNKAASSDDTASSEMRLVANTNEQQTVKAKLTAEQMGTDMIFDSASIKNEISRAIQIGIVDSIGIGDGVDALSFNLQLENLAAYHAFYQQKAEESYSGTELEQVLQVLDAEFDTGLEQVIGNLTGNGTARYMQADMTGVHESITTMFNEYKDYYSNLIKSDDFETGMAGTEYEWLDNTAVFVAGKLRNYADAINDTVQTSAKYSFKDIQAMLVMGESSTVRTGITETNEEQIGMMLGMDAISLRMLEEKGELSEECLNQLKASFEILKDDVIEEVNKKLDVSRADPYRLKGYSYESLDKGAINSAIDIMVQALDSSNLFEGIQNSVSKLLNTFDARQSEQYQNGKVQARYVQYDETDGRVRALKELGYTDETMRYTRLGLMDKNFGYKEAGAFNSFATMLGNKNWLVPERLFRYQLDATI